MILMVAVLGGIFAYWQSVLLATVGQKVVAAVRYDLYRHIQQLSQTFHESASTGDLLARLTGDVRLVRDLLVTSVIYFSARILVLVGTLTVMFLMDWRLTLVTILILPPLIWSTRSFAARIKSAARRQRRKESKVAHVMAENLSAIKVIQAYARESFENERFQRQNAASSNAELRATRLEATMERVIQIILAAGTCAVVWYGVARVQAGALTPGDLLVFSAYLSGLYKPIRKLASLTGRLSKAASCGERLLAILDIQPEIYDRKDAVDPGRLRGDIELKDVSFAYGASVGVLEKANLRIEAGERIALFSPSGSGKSTIVNLIMRFYDVERGTVLLDGHDVRDLKLARVREQVALLPQEGYLFNASIRDNIAYGKLDASDEEIEAAARAAAAHDFIMALEEGYDTVLGERGARLSGGQKQRIAIARAMVRDASLVILDEPASGLDGDSERAVLEAIGRLIEGRTCITITHDAAAACRADRIYTIRDHAIIEVSAEEVMAGTRGPAEMARRRLEGLAS